MLRNIDVVTTVVSAAVSYDLTDLTTIKDELSLDTTDTSNDAWLTRALVQVSRAIMRDTNRVFSPEYVLDTFDIPRNRYQIPSGAQELQLSRWPLLAVVSVIQTMGVVGTTQTLVAGTDFEVDYENGRLLRLDTNTGRVTAWEPMPTAVRYTAGYGAAVTETHTVPSTPYQVTVSQSATFSCDQTVAYANGTVLTPVASGPTVGQYTVASGIYTFSAADAGQSLTFHYCTEAIPDDLVDATLRLVVARYKGRGRDPALIQRDTPGIGTERFWFGGAPGQSGQFPPDIQAMLDGYRSPLVA